MIFEADPADDPDEGSGIPHRRRRLRPVDLRVPRRRHPQHQRVRDATTRARKVVLLEQNYRSTQNILSAANAVIGHNFDRKDKKLWTDVGAGEKIIGFTGYSQHDEAQFVADEIETLRRGGVDYSQMAVFYRTNSQSRALEEIFIRSALPYKIMGGTKFYERAEIKDALAYLIAVSNPADEMALRRIINRPRRGIGDVTIEAISRYAANEQITFRDALANSSALGVGPKIQAAIAHLDAVLAEAIRAHAARDRRARAADRRRRGAAAAARQDRLHRRAAREPRRRRTRRGSRTSTSSSPSPASSRATTPRARSIDFLAEVALVSDADDLEDASGSVSLMTMHTAKGLEYDAVFVTGVEEDLIPHRISAGEPGGPQEERRLFYVGITRARKRLYLSLAMTRAQFGEVSVAMPSRFLQEIPPELVHWRQSPGDVNSRGGTQSRALNARRPGGSGQRLRRRRYGDDLVSEVDRRSSASRTASPRRCATTATCSWRRATASGTTTSARDEWMPSPARARSASRTCASTRPAPRSC